MSRTPLRLALSTLAHEGLLELCPAAATRCARSRARTSTRRSSCAACWRARRRGSRPSARATRPRRWPRCTSSTRTSTRSCTTQSYESFVRYVDLNERFHAVLLEAAASPVLSRAIAQVVALPFASPSAFVLAEAELPSRARSSSSRTTTTASWCARSSAATAGGPSAGPRARAAGPPQPGDRAAPTATSLRAIPGHRLAAASVLAGSRVLYTATSGGEMSATANGEPTRAAETFTLPDFPRNAWYAAAYDVELKHELLPRTICGNQIVMYRRTDGTPVALENACWHRLLPLSKGSLEGDEVVCGYHGLMYNGEGRCVFMPSQKTINPSARVRAYPVLERHRFVWVWTGDPALADPDKSPTCTGTTTRSGRATEAHPRRVQLQARRRQPDGPHARDVRARLRASAALDRRGPVPGHARPGLRDRHALDGRRRAAAVLEDAARVEDRRAGRQRRPLADHPLPGALDDRDRRRRRADRHGRAGGRPLAGRQRLRAQHDDAGDRPHLPLLLGVRRNSASTTSASPTSSARASPACSARTR